MQWKVCNNKSNSSIKIVINLKKEDFDFSQRYIIHRFRKLYSNSIYARPIDWKYEYVISSARLELFYPVDFLKKEKIYETLDIKNIYEFFKDFQALLIPILNYTIENHEKNRYDLFKLTYKKKLIPKVDFFFPSTNANNISNSKNEDLRFIKKLIEKFDGQIQEINAQYNQTKKIIRDFKKILEEIKTHYKDYQSLKQIFEQNEALTKEKYPISYLNFLAQAEFFYKIREIYKYKKSDPEQLKKQGITVLENEIALSIDYNFQDLHFGKLKKPSIQELWDELTEDRRISRDLVIFPDTKLMPNPFLKTNRETFKAEWVRVHIDQPLMLVRSKKSSNFPKGGFLYIYEFGDLDLIQKKNYFIRHIIKSELFENVIKDSNEIEEEKLEKNFCSREELVENILNNRDLFAVQGPPGTGKTYLATEVVYNLLKKYPSKKVLITAKEHLALNHILKTISKKLTDNNISFKAYRSMSQERLRRGKFEKSIEKYIKTNVIKEISSLDWRNDNNESINYWKIEQNKIVKEADLRNQSISEQSSNIFCCTTMDSALYSIIGMKTFDLVIIEEAGKCYPTELLHILDLGQNVLLIGDQKQLPPYQIIQTKEATHLWEKCLQKSLNSPTFQLSLVERFGVEIEEMIRYFQFHGPIQDSEYIWLKPFETIFKLLPQNKKFLLNEEYRMEKPLSNVISHVFYDQEFIHRKKKTNPLDGIIPKELFLPLLWINTPHCLDFPDSGEDPDKTGERLNKYECKIIETYLNTLKQGSLTIKEGDEEQDLVILTPYRDQKFYLLEQKSLKDTISRLFKNPQMKDLTKFIKTTDEYQGQEAHLTILSLVRNNTLSARSSWGFMSSPERLNVMFSRTISCQVVVGCSSHIIRNKDDEEVVILNDLFEEYQKEGKIILAKEFLDEYSPK